MYRTLPFAEPLEFDWIPLHGEQIKITKTALSLRGVPDRFYGILDRLIDSASAWDQGGWFIEGAKFGTAADVVDERSYYRSNGFCYDVDYECATFGSRFSVIDNRGSVAIRYGTELAVRVSAQSTKMYN
jgi:hypothetical protein